MLNFGAKLITLLLLLGGAIAIIGNYIGRSIGRRRLTLFNLRPRHTATAITILTGILISVVTIGSILAVSQDARTALFGLEELRKEVAQKSSFLDKTKFELSLRVQEKAALDQELEDKQKELSAAHNDLAGALANLKRAKREISALEQTRNKLAQEIETSRRGNVMFKVNEVMLTSVIKAGPEKDKLAVGLKQILSAADAYVRSFSGISQKQALFISPEDFDWAVKQLSQQSGDSIVMVTATRNTLFNETVPVRFKLEPNRLIYQAGEVISEVQVSPKRSVPELEQEIKKLLSLTKQAAKTSGVLPDASGSIGSVAYAEIFSLAKKIKANNKPLTLKTLAKQNIYSIGPLEVNFKIFYQ